MPSNTVRPALRILIAARDNGICQICGEPIVSVTKSKRIKRNKIPTLPQGGEILSGDYPTIDHIYPALGKTSGEQILNGQTIYLNLALAHKSCNVEKGDNEPNEREKRASIRPITAYVLYKVNQVKIDLKISEKQVTDRSEGRLLFRIIAQYFAEKMKPTSDEIPF
jgi:5-methylcytosine-specific restriction endonuclease McrA